ncbi:hypothetical protein TVAG_172890 [Trichomonas vaginalis G3]|uniref:Uncharacterized protein n=1 Tax=Trichomonas vaginalis (strain ATCC PRA-98 / G3) TaxID=412133 RepID=A2DF39_TRIV3|nr:hypothetical protein TVAGG3_0531870 [Trichomonas vaginalis G3]EAY21031.1 hypothetical protein TVAG_172890 [Trichomonas vaginalis G3]KAI5519206.1 hypothetical protein TVAGG3_0531870 [Trichomonas vaginalis G3]|eukprot:XP_001582017.1 hypothetical protein [Trichomonas vaginalis G3]
MKPIPFKRKTEPVEFSKGKEAIRAPFCQHSLNKWPQITDPSLVYIKEVPLTPELEGEFMSTFSTLTKNYAFEKASEFVIRDINSLENLIDSSNSPKCKHIIQYPITWDPNEFTRIFTDIQTALKDPDDTNNEEENVSD